MDIAFLGTGAGMPSRDRNVSALAILLPQELGCCWLFDCGEGTQQQILRSSANALTLAKIDRVFVTHLHGDHLYGLPGLLGSRSNYAGAGPLTLYGPPGLRTFVETSLGVCHTHLNYDYTIFEIADGLVADVNGYRITCEKLNHRIDSFGYRIAEPTSPGKLDVNMLQRLNVPAGPLWGRLKRGESVLSPSGSVVAPDRVLGPARQGRVVTILGDTAPCDAAQRLASNADVLVHEATYATAEAALAIAHGHSTAADAARTAAQARAGQLLLTHISPRYHADAGAELLAQARSIFAPTALATDGACFPVPRHADRR